MKTEGSAALPATSHQPGIVPVIVRIGLIARSLDIAENLIFNQFRGVTPKMVFQYIASGLIGMKSFHGGTPSVALGVALHYLIAFIWTGGFYGHAVKSPFFIAARLFAVCCTEFSSTCS